MVNLQANGQDELFIPVIPTVHVDIGDLLQAYKDKNRTEYNARRQSLFWLYHRNKVADWAGLA